jgi:hypothetical protein
MLGCFDRFFYSLRISETCIDHYDVELVGFSNLLLQILNMCRNPLQTIPREMLVGLCPRAHDGVVESYPWYCQ